MAESKENVGSSVIVKLIADDNIKDLPKRTITLTEHDDTLQIGRASKVATKGFVAATDNAWFDSPVMSRNHAEIVASFDERAVYIRDIGSLHGTFIDGEPEGIKTNHLVQIHDGTRVTFGVPIWRNSESFAPATVKVGITHDSGTNPSPAAGSTFALPEYVDDESSSSDDDVEEIEEVEEVEEVEEAEEAEEAEEEFPVSSMQVPSKSTVVDLTEGQRQGDIVDLTDMEMSDEMDRTADRLIDLTSPPRDESPDMGAEDENEADLKVLHATAMILDKIVDNRRDRDGSDIGSPSSQDSESLDLSDDGSDSTDSELSMEDVEDDQSNDDEGSNSDDDGADWDVEYSSADDVLDQDDPDTAVWGPVEEPMVTPAFLAGNHELNGAPCNATYDNNVPLDAPKAKLDHLFGFAGPFPVPYFPVSENAPVFAPARVTLPSILNPAVRPASPLDASHPKRSVNFPSVLPLDGSSTAEALGERTGKYEYFAAREENRHRTFAPSRQSTAPSVNEGWVRSTDYSKPAMSETNAFFEDFPHAQKRTIAEKPTAIDKQVPPENPKAAQEQHLESSEATEKQPAAEKLKAIEKAAEVPSVAEKPDAQELQPTAKHGPSDIPKSFAANQTVVITPLLRRGDIFLNRPQNSTEVQLPTYPGDDTDEPISAYELQKRKLAAQKQLKTMTNEPKLTDGARRTLASISIFPNSPQYSTEVQLPTYPGDDIHEPMSANELQKRKLATQKQLKTMTNEPKLTDGTRRTHVGISDIIDVSPAPAPEPATQAAVAGCSKRKADAMLELSDQEVQWEASESKLMRHLLAAEEIMLRPAPMSNDGLRLTPLPQPEARIVNTSKHVEPISDVRAPKRLRLRKIAERLGYAALGGATVGAALVSTLIYTAPTFT